MIMLDVFAEDDKINVVKCVLDIISIIPHFDVSKYSPCLRVISYMRPWVMPTIFNATGFGYECAVKYLVDHGAAIDGESLLNTISFGRDKIMRYLINTGTIAKQDEMLAAAVSAENMDLIEHFLSQGANPNTCIVRASRACNENIVRIFLDHGADPCYSAEIIINATIKDRLELFKYLESRGAHDDSVLSYATEYHSCGVFNYLLDDGRDIHVCDDEPLRRAALHGYEDFVVRLVEMGANIHAKDDEALSNAIEGGHDNVVKYLISKGATMPKN